MVRALLALGHTSCRICWDLNLFICKLETVNPTSPKVEEIKWDSVSSSQHCARHPVHLFSGWWPCDDYTGSSAWWLRTWVLGSHHLGQISSSLIYQLWDLGSLLTSMGLISKMGIMLVLTSQGLLRLNELIICQAVSVWPMVGSTWYQLGTIKDNSDNKHRMSASWGLKVCFLTRRFPIVQSC